MPNYVRRTGDVKFRKVSVLEAELPGYQVFTAPGESVQYKDFQVVEVLRDDGTTHLFHEPGVVKVNYTAISLNRFLIDKNVPLARVWMRRNDGTGIEYKVPAALPVVGNSVEVRVPSGVQDMELFGDKYFQMVYTF